MRNIPINFFAVLFSISLICSCKAHREKLKIDPTEQVKSITLLSTMIGPIRQPTLPLIDASLFNEKTNKISGQIMACQTKVIDAYQKIVADGLSKTYGCTVNYGDALKKMTNYSFLKDSLNFAQALYTGDAYYNTVTIPSNELNHLNFTDTRPYKFLKNSTRTKASIQAIAKYIETDLFAISYSRLNVAGVRAFGRRGDIRLDTQLLLFNKNGTLVSIARNGTVPTKIVGIYQDEYQSKLNEFSKIFDYTLKKSLIDFKYKSRRNKSKS